MTLPTTHWTKADLVAGTYIGVPFTGRLRSWRGHTINHQTYLANVDLTEPVIVFDSQRTSIHLAVHWDGTNADSYGGTGDSIRAVTARQDGTSAPAAAC